MFLEYLSLFGAAFLAAFGFGVLYNVPSRTILASSLSGAAGWIVYYFLSVQVETHLFVGAGAASFIVAFLSQWCARRFKMPVIVFAIPGIIPMVPGGSAYTMMRMFIEGNTSSALTAGTETFLISGAIALGLSVNSGIVQAFSKRAFDIKDKRYLP
ncbi:threonine/serine exporter family protein [Alkalibacterium sp. MB6]|uniref:threonine/serine exporter family protein n=1 Tax=Alkalibacterium sp. MB6 TaxID=2081965 RepID=UPI00137B37E9|nr:threonine/serine exporter family protein [Alkalibacterium sp. MB6]